MESTAKELATIVDRYFDRLISLNEDVASKKPSPSKWSKKEIMGHLIDSAQNNIRRFIVAQYEDTPHIRYDQDKWVTLSNYQNSAYKDIVTLWALLNKNIVQVLQKMNPEMAQRKCSVGDVKTVESLAVDYIKHLMHHLHQVLDLEPIAYP